ncbi:MAG: hypothetical protein IJN99_00030 [Clostridia bacterium]|nr:hypothetical protein [Clostridia bacterium]
MKKFVSLLTIVAMLICNLCVATVWADASLTITMADVETEKLAGTVSASFSAEVDPATLDGNIHLMLGISEIPIYATVNETTKTQVDVSYGDLVEGEEYTLEFVGGEDGIKDKDGNTLAEDKTVTISTSQSVYRVKSEAPYTPASSEHAAGSLLNSGIYVGAGQVRYRDDRSKVSHDGKTEMALWQAGTMITDKGHYNASGHVENTITTDFVIEFSFLDRGSAGSSGRHFTIASDKYVMNPNGNNNTFTIMSATTEPRTSINLANSTAANPKIELADGTPTTLDLQMNSRGLYDVRLASCMGDDGNFDMEMSSGTASAMVDFKKYTSFGSFRAYSDTASPSADNATYYGSFNIYRITPLAILKHGFNSDRTAYEITMNDDIAKFGTNPVLTQARYNSATRTFTIQKADLPAILTVSLEGLRSDDGAFADETLAVSTILPIEAVTESVSIEKLAGKFSVELDHNIDAKTLKNKVSLVKDGGETAEQIVAALDPTDSKKVIITHGDLEDDVTYKLTFASGILDTTGEYGVADPVVIDVKTDQSVYRVKSSAPYMLDSTVGKTYAEYSGSTQLETGIYVAQGQVRYRTDRSSAYDNKAEMTLYQPTTRITDKYSYLVSNGLTNTITTDFAIEFSFKDLGTAGTGGRYFTIAPDAYAMNPDGNNNTFTIMPKTTEPRTQIQLTESTADNPMIQLAEGTNTTLNLQENTRGLYDVRLASCMGDDGNFDMEMSSGTASAMVDFDKFESFGSFVAFNDGKTTYSENATYYGSFNIYRITPLGIMATEKAGESYKIIMNDDITKFPETGIFVESNYNAATRTFTIPLNTAKEYVSTPASLAGLRTNDGAFSSKGVVFEDLIEIAAISDFTNLSTEITATYAEHKMTEETTLFLAVYSQDKMLKKVAVAIGENQVTLPLADVVCEEGDYALLFVFDGITTIRPLLENPLRADYRESQLTTASVLGLSTQNLAAASVRTENFSVLDAYNGAVGVNDVYYNPRTGEIELDVTLNEAAKNKAVTVSSNLTDVNGNATVLSFASVALDKAETEPESVGGTAIFFKKNGQYVDDIAQQTGITTVVRIANATGTTKNGNVKIYDNNILCGTNNFTVNGDSVEYIEVDTLAHSFLKSGTVDYSIEIA